MYVDIFDGVWNDGFIILDSGKIVSSSSADNPYKQSVYSNLIVIKKDKAYHFGFNQGTGWPYDYRIRSFNVDGTYKGDLQLSKYVTLDTDSKNRIFKSSEDIQIRILFYTGINDKQKTNFYFKEEQNMAIKSADQITIFDVTDAYSVMLTSEAYTFVGNTIGAPSGLSCSTEAAAFHGKDQCSELTVNKDNIILPAGFSATVENNGTSRVKIIFTTTATITTDCEATIPVVVDGLTMNKKFSFAVAKAGTNGADGTSVDISNTSVTYQVGTSGTNKPTGTWQSTVPSIGKGKYLWTKTVVTYSDGNSTESYSVSYQGVNGTSVTISNQSVTYQTSSSGTIEPTGTWQPSVPSVSEGQFLWTKTVVTYSDGTSTTSYSVSYKGTNGKNGEDGEDAILLIITASNGNMFKNSSGSTVLTAHVYKGGVEQTVADNGTVSGLGTIKWYKNGKSTLTAVATAKTLTVSAKDVKDSQAYTCQLEG